MNISHKSLSYSIYFFTFDIYFFSFKFYSCSASNYFNRESGFYDSATPKNSRIYFNVYDGFYGSSNNLSITFETSSIAPLCTR